MALSLLAPIAARARGVAALLLPAVLIAAGGCGKHHTRTSLRPIYTRPAVPCPTGNCGGGVVVPATPVPSATLSPAASAPSTTIEPPLVEPGSAAGASVSQPPSSVVSTPPAPEAPARSNDTPPPVTGPAVPGAFPDEPGLEPAGGEERQPTADPAPRDSNPGKPAAPGSFAPGTSLRNSTTGGRRVPLPRPRQAALREQVRPFVNDPDGLFSPPKADRPWKYIVLHHSASPAGGYDSIDRAHRDRLGWQGCGYHFVIGNGSESPDGSIEVARRWTDQKLGVHCRDGKNPDVNEYGIGICLVGDLEKSPPTPRQVAAAQALVAYLGQRYRIPADHTETHAHLAASPTTCPGRHFPAQAILGSSGLALR